MTMNKCKCVGEYTKASLTSCSRGDLFANSRTYLHWGVYALVCAHLQFGFIAHVSCGIYLILFMHSITHTHGHPYTYIHIYM